MSTLSKKIRLIYAPFLIIGIGFILIYTILNWLLFIKFQIVSVNEEIVNLWLPLTLPFIAVWVWLKPRINLLDLRMIKGDLPSVFAVIAGIAIVVPAIIAQRFMETATGKLIKLDNISHVNDSSPSKYYSLNTFYIDKSNVGVETKVEESGKYNQYLDISVYLALPILTGKTDAPKYGCFAWYGVKYHKQISNKLSSFKKEDLYQSFIGASQADFNRKDLSQFVYLQRLGNTNDHTAYIAAMKNSKRYSGASTILLIPIDEPFDQRNGNKLAWIFGAFGIGAAIWFLMLLSPDFDKDASRKVKREGRLKLSELKATFSFFAPRPGFFTTVLLIDLNILVFIAMVISGLGLVSFKAADLLTWGANFRPLTSNGQWWRLLTSTFLHGGLMHLLANMIGLGFVGFLLEPVLGKIKLAIIYLFTGIFASFASLLFHDNTVSVGASGAIFGLYGTFLAFLSIKVYPKNFSNAFAASTLLFIGYNLLMGFSGGVDNAAHVGGLISGFVIGGIIAPQIKSKMNAPKLGSTMGEMDELT